MAVSSSREAAARTGSPKGDVIQIRTSAETKAILNRAAALRGQTLSEFMLESARRQAQEVLADERAFVLESETFNTFLAQLDVRAEPASQLADLMQRKPPWEA